MSRSLTKLNEVADELAAKYPTVSTKVVAVDFSNFDAAAQGKVRSVVESLEVGTLINNVGMSYPYPTYFHELSHGDVQAMIALNVTSTTIMTHLVLPSMVQRKRGAIVCISSAASQLPANPLLAQYAAAKAYVDKSVGGKRGREKNKQTCSMRASSSWRFVPVSDIALRYPCFFFPCLARPFQVRRVSPLGVRFAGHLGAGAEPALRDVEAVQDSQGLADRAFAVIVRAGFG